MALSDSNPQLTEDAIVEGLMQNGISKTKAEETLFRKFDYFINEGIRNYSLTREDSFDAYSDTILSAIGSINDGSFEGRSSLKTWLFRIFQNKCVDLLRKKSTNKYSVHNTQEISGMLNMLPDNARNIVQQLLERTDMDLLMRRLQELGEQCKRMLLFWADGYPDKEIAGMLEYKTADVVKTSRLRCMEKLRQLYKDHKS